MSIYIPIYFQYNTGINVMIQYLACLAHGSLEYLYRLPRLGILVVSDIDI